VAQVTGAIWCFVGWGNTFSWGARHLGSAAIWTFFAAALHLPLIRGWKSKSAAMAVAGGVLVFYISYSSYLREMQFMRVGG
jgi:ABC-type transport system involved in cytochrome c biogenesis permease subunit